jgi:hypothetical protein
MSGVDVGDRDFGNFKKISLSGTKYRDLTNNGLSGDDTPLGGVTINLFKDMNGNDMLDGGDGAAIATTITAPGTGAYSFGGLTPGTYFVREVAPAGYLQTAGDYTVMAMSGVDVSKLDFANFKREEKLGSISGRKVEDKCGDGITMDDKPLGGVTIKLFKDMNNDGMLTGADGMAIASTVTAPMTGAYSFTNLALGTYFVQEVVPSGYVHTTPITLTVTLTAGMLNATKKDFANFKLIDICGMKFHDKDGDGKKDYNEPGLKGWTIFLDSNCNGKLDKGERYTTTDDCGNYCFQDLGPGKYRVREVQKAGWQQTTKDPADIKAVSGCDVKGVNFGNDDKNDCKNDKDSHS